MVSKLQSLTNFWQEFDLPKVQSNLDDFATEITSRQDDSDVSRKALIEMMREFKKDKDEETRTAVAPLVKAFQNEVDNLSKRSKSAEKAFFDAYKQLTDMSDPVPVLLNALEAQKSLAKVSDMEIEIRQLRETIGDYNKEIQEYKAKEKKMVELQSKVDAYDKNIDDTLNEKIQELSETMVEEYNEKLALIEEDKAAVSRKSEDLEGKLRATQKQLKDVQAELFEAQNGSEEKKNAKTEEVEILLNDLEVSNHRAASAEKEIELLKERLDALKERDTEETRRLSQEREEEESMIPNLTRELSAKEREVQHLIADVTKLKAERQQEKEEAEIQIRNLTYEASESAKAFQALESKLQRQSDYEQVKKDLSILKTMEFPQDPSDESKRPLEVMILERSKTLQSENTSLRVEKDRYAEELKQTKKSLTEKASESERQAQLIAELEDHVERLQELSTTNRGEAEGRSSADILVDALDISGGGSGGGGRASVNSEQSNSLLQLSGDSEFESSKALLPIVQAQRERFRQRNEELEDEQAKHVQQIALLQSEVKDLQMDNVKLYEKIRYLQGFQGSKGGDTTVVPVETRYKTHYEQKLDPFSSFSHQERQKRYGQLNVVEKIILSFVQFMMSNKFARFFVFAYSVLLHLLVFMVLMKLAYNDAFRRDLASEWHDKYMQHMEEEHSNNG